MAGVLLALFWILVALLGALGALAFLLGFGGRT